MASTRYCHPVVCRLLQIIPDQNVQNRFFRFFCLVKRQREYTGIIHMVKITKAITKNRHMYVKNKQIEIQIQNDLHLQRPVNIVS